MKIDGTQGLSDAPKPYCVFISHNHANKATAREIGIFLIAEDINVWFDEWQISYGESIPRGVEIGLKSCTHFLLLWSKNAAEAPWVQHELESALYSKLSNKNPDLKIIPILLDETPLPTNIASILAVQYGSGSELDRYNIVKAITGDTSSQNFIQAIIKKYNELLFSDDFSYKACPNCGNLNLNNSSYTDYQHDETYYTFICKKCGWSDWNQ